MEQLLTTLHQTVIMFYSGVIISAVMIPVYLSQDIMDWMENFRPYLFGNLQVLSIDLSISISQIQMHIYVMIAIVPPSDVTIPVTVIVEGDLQLITVINVSIQ